MSIYLDASVIVALFLDDPFASRADLAVRGKGVPLIVSDFAAAEFASSVARHVRTGEVSRQEAQDAFSDFDIWIGRAFERTEATNADMLAAQVFLRRLDLNLRTPDALNIAIAQRIGAQLATFDVRMAENAKSLGVPLAAV